MGATATRSASASLVRNRQGRRETFLLRTPERLMMPAMSDLHGTANYDSHAFGA
jgi:hypothetical protein